MSVPRPRTTFGDEHVDRLLTDVLAAVGTDANDDLIRSLLVTALDMDSADVDRLELKIAAQALVEMLNSWQVFSAEQATPKVTVFGSARTKPGAADYELARDFGAAMSSRGWMAITGAGPGIMTAGIEGAGLDRSFGVSIVLPFEARAAEIIDGDPKLAAFKYFFTRKLSFMKESDAFALFPGGFGTLDEAFELLTLIQTGKSYPAPVVLIDHPGSSYWSGWIEFVRRELLGGGMINEDDLGIFLHTHDAEEAAAHLAGFYACYHSLRYVGQKLVLRLRSNPSDETVATLNDEFADIVVSGGIERADATASEQRDGDHVDLPRLALRFDNRSFGRLVRLIWRINELGRGEQPQADLDLVHDVGPDPHAEL